MLATDGRLKLERFLVLISVDVWFKYAHTRKTNFVVGALGALPFLSKQL